MSEFAPKNPQTPRGEVNRTLQGLKQGAIAEHTPNSDRVKAEIYGITAFFVEKIAKDCREWVLSHPGRAYSFAQFDVSKDMQRSDSYEVDEATLIGSGDLDTVLFGISQAIEGVTHIAIDEYIHPHIDSAGMVQQSEHERQALQRLETLLLQYPKLDSGSAESFLMAAAIPPALFIPLVLRAGLHKYKEAFGTYPKPNTEAFADLQKQLMKIILKLTQINILELRTVVGLTRVQRNGKPDFSNNFEELISFSKTETGFSIDAPKISNYKPNVMLETDTNPTLGCPAIYAKVESQNAIRFFTDYAVDLLSRSGVYSKQ